VQDICPPMPQQIEFSSSDTEHSDAESDSDSHIEMPIRRRSLVEEPTTSPPSRRISERTPAVPPTLQLRRPSASSPPMRVVSGLSAFAHSPNPQLQFVQLTHPGPGTIAPPCVTTTSALATDLPYAPLTVGSASSVKERINLLQSGLLPEETPSQDDSPDSSTRVLERISSMSSPNKSVSLENSRYALSPEAHQMIRRLSNGPPGSLHRATSPSPPMMPSGWTQSQRTTRTMQRQVLYRDLEQQAQGQQPDLFSPIITRTDSARTEYFDPTNDPEVPSLGGEQDPFLNSFPMLKKELQRINNELNNVKKFGDPLQEALQRLAVRQHDSQTPASIPTRPPLPSSTFSLSSSLLRRFSPEKPPESTRKNSLPSRLREITPPTETHEDEDGPPAFTQERESKFRELTRELWFSRPESNGTQQDGTQQDGTTSLNGDADETSVLPTDVRRTVSAVGESRRGGLMGRTWGSALALAGLR
jgi:hypothetical protein